MIAYLKARWPLLLILVVFIACKFHHLYYPFYWDESWSYAPALDAMYQHGPSLMPGAMDPEISRGHPLMYHNLVALWMYVFGTSHFAMHSFSLFISVLFIIANYEAALRLFNQRAAVISTLLVVLLEMFFVQSSFMLPEVMVAFFAFLSLCFYVKDKYILTALFLTALFYTKESGMVLGMILGMDAAIGLFRKQTQLKQRLYRLISIAVPCILILVFFLIQKHTRGWYLFPEHIGMIKLTWNDFWYVFRMCCIRITFYDYYQYWYYLLLAVIAVIAAIKNKNVRYLAILIPVVIIYYFVDEARAGRILPSVPFFITFVLSISFFVYTYCNSKLYPKAEQRKLIGLTVLFVLLYDCFCAINFFTARYLLSTAIPMLFITGVLMDMLIAHSYKALYYPAIALILAIGVFSFRNNDNYGDIELGAYDAMEVQQAVVNYFEKNVATDKAISGPPLEVSHLSKPVTGFLHGNKTFKNIHWGIGTDTDYIIFDNIERDNRYDLIKKDTAFHVVYRAEKGKVWAEVFERK